jgi:hypothetical protein
VIAIGRHAAARGQGTTAVDAVLAASARAATARRMAVRVAVLAAVIAPRSVAEGAEAVVLAAAVVSRGPMRGDHVVMRWKGRGRSAMMHRRVIHGRSASPRSGVRAVSD